MPRKITVTFEDGSTHIYDNAPDDVTPEQVTERAQKEFGLTVTALDGGRSGAAPVVQDASQTAAALPTSAPVQDPVTQGVSTSYKMRIDRLAEGYENYEIQPLSDPDAQEYVRLARDPSVTFDDLNAWLGEKGYDLNRPGAREEFETYRKALAEGKSVSNQINYLRPADVLMGEYTPYEDPSLGNDAEAALEKGMAYNPMGVVTRMLTDFSDQEVAGFTKEDIARLYPNVSPEGIEKIHDSLIGEFRRRELINANYQVDQRDVNPVVEFIGDAVGGASPLDIIPLGRGATLGWRLAQGAVGNFIGDAVLQAGDVAYGAQREYDPVQGAMAAVTGAAFQGAVEVPFAVARKLITPKSPEGTTSSFVYPEGRRNSKKYMAGLEQAQEQVIDRVNTTAKGWTNAPKMEVHTNFRELKGIDDNALGVYREDGTVLLNTEAILARAQERNVAPEAVVDSVVFHEALGHYGMTQRWGDELDNVLGTIYDNANPLLREKIDEWIRKNPNAYKYSPQNAAKEDPRWQAIRATEEVMAKWSEKNGVLPKRVWDTILNRIKNYARDMGLNLKVSEREVKAYLATAQRRVTEGEPTGFTPGTTKNAVDDEFYGGSDRTYSSGSQRPKTDERSKTEARKQFWRNKENPDWNPDDPNGLPSGPKYMRGDGPIDPDTLTGEDLANANDALEILNRIDYVPTAVSQADLEQAMQARGLYPSDIVRLSSVKPGDLQKKQYLYDIAAQKLSERMAAVKEDMRINGLNERNQLEYMKATLALNEATTKLFNLQSEAGRVLNYTKKNNFSMAKIKNLKELLERYGVEDLEEAMNDPETFNKFMAEVEAQLAARTGQQDARTQTVLSVLNLPRAIMSSMDLSAPLRQGIVFIGTTNYWKAFGKMFTFLGPNGRDRYGYLMRQIAKHPNYSLMKKAKLGFSDIDGMGLTSREEDFQSDLINKYPKVFMFVRQSEQAYAGFLNKLRADMFNKYIEQYKKAGIDVNDPELLKGLGRFINSATGRADLPGGLASMAPQLNALFFSPRLMVSRFNMIANPVFYKRLPTPVRKEAIKSMLSFATIAGMTLGAFALFGGDETEIEWDPRSSDFGKVKVGETRFDIGGGFNQYITLGARTLSWLAGIEAVKTSTGDMKELGPEQGKTSYGETVARFFRSKLSPNASFVVDAAFEENVVGEPFTVGGSALSRLVPLHMQAVWEAHQNESAGVAAAVGLAGLFGVGTNTYTPAAVNREQELDVPESITFDEEEYVLTEEQQQFFKETRNNYFRTFVDEFTAETGKPWDQLTTQEQKDIIEDAKKEAQTESRLDMLDALDI